MVIRIANIVPGANTADQGVAVLSVLKDAMRTQDPVVVSFDGIQTATSSFVNVSFVELLNDFSYTDIKSRLRVTKSTRQINDMIKTRLDKSARLTA
jgi:hypothetical protein